MVSQQRQQGVALILVLLVVALMTIIATRLGFGLQLGIQRAENRQQYQQAYWYALGGERLARELIESALESEERIHPGQAWASPLLRYPIDGGQIHLVIEDQRACFNINALTTLNTPQSADYRAAERGSVRQLSALLRLLAFEPGEAENMIEPLRDWLDSDTLPTGLNGVEDLYYSSRVPPYLPANGPLTSMSELYYIDGFVVGDNGSVRDERRERLGRMLCAVPNDRVILNLNTLAPEHAPVLGALFEDKVPLDEIEEWLQSRPGDGIASVDEFWEALTTGRNGHEDLDVAVKEQLSVSSEYFQVRVEVNYYDARLLMYAKVRVRDGKAYTYQRQYGELEQWPARAIGEQREVESSSDHG